MRLTIIDFEPYGKITLSDIGNGPDEGQGSGSPDNSQNDDQRIKNRFTIHNRLLPVRILSCLIILPQHQRQGPS
jgi:hypothetical protein